MKPRLLDLFCGAGGAAMGYHRAGFDVVGVDIEPQPNYPFMFIQHDALCYLDDVVEAGMRFDAIHASPPCQAHSSLKARWRDREHADFLAETQERLRDLVLPYVIENVVGAPLDHPVTLCGSMFGLDVRRHRLFEASFPMLIPPCQHAAQDRIVQVNGHPGGSSLRDGERHSAAEWREAMGIDWMTTKELAQAIPPAYTQYIGERLFEHLSAGTEVAA
jgi:DNA (cytosine-5)-methyltransferase 1